MEGLSEGDAGQFVVSRHGVSRLSADISKNGSEIACEETITFIHYSEVIKPQGYPRFRDFDQTMEWA